MSAAYDIAALRSVDTCSVANAIERFGIRLRNEGYVDGSIRCRISAGVPMVGHAVTARIRCASPPPEGHAYHERTAWWDHILSVPYPRVVIIQDMDGEASGTGALVGEIHAEILKSLGCDGIITNGAVRDLDRIADMAMGRGGFHVHSGTVAVSHAYAHLISFGGPVTIGGLTITTGDLLHGDRHGVINVPKEIASDIPTMAARQRKDEQSIIDMCRSDGFHPQELRRLLDAMGETSGIGRSGRYA